MVQNKLNGEKIVRKRRRGNEDYVLTGKLFCGYCLAPMVGMSGRSHVGREHFYYACQTRRTKNTCSKENVRKDDIEAEVVRIYGKMKRRVVPIIEFEDEDEEDIEF